MPGEFKPEIRIFDRHLNKFYTLDYHIGFFGDCLGVVLTIPYQKPEPYVKFVTVVEDDENWFVSSSTGSDTFWLAEYLEQLQKAETWLRKNCFKYEHGYIYYLDRTPTQPGIKNWLMSLLSHLRPRKLFKKLLRK